MPFHIPFQSRGADNKSHVQIQHAQHGLPQINSNALKQEGSASVHSEFVPKAPVPDHARRDILGADPSRATKVIVSSKTVTPDSSKGIES